MHPQAVVDHRQRIAPHLAGAGRMVHADGVLPDVTAPVVVGADVRAGQVLACDEARERLGGEDRAEERGAQRQSLDIALVGQQVRLDRRLVERVGGLQADGAGGTGPVQVGQTGDRGLSNSTGPASVRS